MIYITSNGTKIDICKNHHKNTYIGVFLNQSGMPKIYGDNEAEVMEQAEEMEKEDNG